MCLKKLSPVLLVIALVPISALAAVQPQDGDGRTDGKYSLQVNGFSSGFQGEKPRKSALLAIAYSLILPGLGDAYAENLATGKYFMGTDAGLWLTYGGFRVLGQWLKDDAKMLAVQRGSANFNGKDDKFEVNIGNFDDVLSYNAAKLRNRDIRLTVRPELELRVAMELRC